ncbi:hypothetical protein CYMTET_42363, partial [Cymbomonas tetramitiformis]
DNDVHQEMMDFNAQSPDTDDHMEGTSQELPLDHAGLPPGDQSNVANTDHTDEHNPHATPLVKPRSPRASIYLPMWKPDL